MDTPTIESLLKTRGAWLKGRPPEMATVRARSEMTRTISRNYRLFEEVRDRVLRNTDSFLRHLEIVPETISPEGHNLVRDLLDHKIVLREDHGHEICEAEGRRYMSGGWLEELAWLAAADGGADEAVFGQVLGWTVKGYTGENEIDLIMRKGDKLGFVSCKALRSELDIHDRKHRNRLMDALHEADNLADHFGRDGDGVAILVSTDLIDEAKGAVRYNALMGKAAVLNVRIIPLEEMAFELLSQALASLWQSTEEIGNVA
jgi:Domain of unknown function (DUF1887)